MKRPRKDPALRPCHTVLGMISFISWLPRLTYVLIAVRSIQHIRWPALIMLIHEHHLCELNLVPSYGLQLKKTALKPGQNEPQRLQLITNEQFEYDYCEGSFLRDSKQGTNATHCHIIFTFLSIRRCHTMPFKEHWKTTGCFLLYNSN